MGRNRKAPKKSAEVEYSYCGVCVVGQSFVCPASIDDKVPTDCNHVFVENFQMFLRKQKDKNTQTSMQIRMKHEQRMEFASLTKLIGNINSDDYEKKEARCLMTVGERFFTKWVDDLLEGFEGAEVVIPLFLDWKFNISTEAPKKFKEFVISARRWVVEQLDVALEEFKEFRDGLDEKERENYDNLVEKQNQKWSDFECGDLSFKEVDVIIKDIQKKMDDIIARHDNQSKDIDSLVELIEGKQFGAISKIKKEKIPKTKKKKNEGIKCKHANQHFENTCQENVIQKSEVKLEKSEAFPVDNVDFKSHETSLSYDTKKADQLKKTKEKVEKFTSEAFSIDNKDFKSPEASMSDDTKMADELKKIKEALNNTKTELEETKNQLREEQSKNVHLNTKLGSLLEENDLLRSKLLQNDYKKYRDVLMHRQKNNRSVIDHLRASAELEHTPQGQLALRSLHEFSALLLLADQQLTSQYDIIYQQSQSSKTVPELHFDLSIAEPPELGSSCINLLYKSILMSQSNTSPLPPPPTSGVSTPFPLGPRLSTSYASTPSPLGSSLPISSARDKTQSSRVAGTISSTMPSMGRQGTGACFSPALVSTGSVFSFPSNGFSAGATHLNIKPRVEQIKNSDSSQLANKITSKKVASFVERGGVGASFSMEDESCSICFEEMRPSDSSYLESCRHRFHVTCLKLWLKSPGGVSSTCPMCRTYIDQEHEFLHLGATRRF